MPVARTGTATCPVAMMEHYYKIGKIAHDSCLPLFRGITNTKSGQRLRAPGSLSYTQMREIFLAKLEELGFDASKFGLHWLAEPPQQLMQVSLTAYSSAMAAGD